MPLALTFETLFEETWRNATPLGPAPADPPVPLAR